MLGLNPKAHANDVFFKKSKNKDEFEDDNDKHVVLIGMSNNKHKEFSINEEKDEDKEHRTIASDIANSTIASKDKKCERQAINSSVDESEHEEAFAVAESEGKLKQESKAVGSVKVLKQDVEKGCAKCKMNQENSRFTEAMCETLVSELKEEWFSMMFKIQEEARESKEEACLGTDDKHKRMEDAFDIKAIEDCHEGDFIQGKKISEELKKKVKHREEEVERKVEVEREREKKLK